MQERYKQKNFDLPIEPEQELEIIPADEGSENNTLKPEYKDKTSEILMYLSEFDPHNFCKDFNDHAEEVLAALLTGQSNAAPAKRGGPTFVYRNEIMIWRAAQRFSKPEDDIFDILLAEVSSLPDKSVYSLTVDDISTRINCAENYSYSMLKNAITSIRDKSLLFYVPDSSGGKDKEISISWFETLVYNPGTNSTPSSVTFVPTPFFRVLACACGKIHGSVYPLNIVTSFRSPFTRKIYVYLNYKKDFRKYRGAQTGAFYWPVDGPDGVKAILGLPSNHRTAELTEKLEKAKADFEKLDVDLRFSFAPVKTKKIITGYEISISKRYNLLEQSAKAQSDTLNPADLLAKIGLRPKEIYIVLKKYNEHNRDISYLSKAIKKVTEKKDLKKNPVALLSYFMENDIQESFVPDPTKQSTDTAKHNNSYSKTERRKLGID